MSPSRRFRSTAVACGLVLLVVAALGLPSQVQAAGKPYLQDGERNVDVQPLKSRGSYVRAVYVFNVPRQRILDALPGPATGPNGFAPKMVTPTPVEKQFVNGRTRVEKMRLPGLPEAMGATVEAWPVPDGMDFRMSEGLTSGAFTIRVGPERLLPDGDTEVRVVEAGHFTIMKTRPKSIFGLPAYLVSNLTPFGWFGQAAGGAAVSKAHIYLFELEAVLRKRLGAE